MVERVNANIVSNRQNIADLEKRNGQMVCDTSNVDLIFNSSVNIPILEQECLINIDRHTGKTFVACTHNNWITKLRKNPALIVTKIVYNDNGKILEMNGYFPTDAVTLRRKVNA